jgi:hypothetical protein
MRLDESNQQISIFITQALETAFQAMALSITPNAQIPVQVGDPVYGPKVSPPPSSVFTIFLRNGFCFLFLTFFCCAVRTESGVH